VATRVFPRLQHDRMALKLNGKDDHLRRADFRELAGTAGVRASAAGAAIDETLRRMKEAVDSIALPDLSDHGAEATAMVEKMVAIIRARLESFG
jgi:serine/threonine-protein kinase HipA